MLKLPRLPRNIEKIPGLFERYWDEVLRSIEKAISSIDTSSRNISLLTSFVRTSSSLYADTTGLVTIPVHVRVYGNGSEVNVNDGFLNTGQSPGSIIRVYYEDTALAGGSVVYKFTTDPDPKPAQKDGVHIVGLVVIPTTGTANGKTLDPIGSIYI